MLNHQWSMRIRGLLGRVWPSLSSILCVYTLGKTNRSCEAAPNGGASPRLVVDPITSGTASDSGLTPFTNVQIGLTRNL